MTYRNLTQVLVAASLVLATAPLDADNALSLRVTPRMAGAPAIVSITVTVEPNADNRVLVVEDDSESYYRRSEVPLDGENATRTHVLTYRGLPAGEHRISAVVGGTGGVRALAHTSVTVTGFGSP